MFFMMFVGMTLAEDIKTRVMIFLVPIVNYAILFHWTNARKDEVQEKLSWKTIAPLICY